MKTIIENQVVLIPALFQDVSYQEVDHVTRWEQKTIKLYGRTHQIPRLTAWYSTVADYTYSGISNAAKPITEILDSIKHSVEQATGAEFNSLLLNKYRTGSDGVAYHSDNEPELGPKPTIASVSLGGTRRFSLKNKATKQVVNLDLNHGDLLIMSGQSQEEWLHAIPKTKKPVDPRINLTFRNMA